MSQVAGDGECTFTFVRCMRVALVLLAAVGRARGTWGPPHAKCAIYSRMLFGARRVVPRWLTSTCVKLHALGEMACQPGQMHAVVASAPGGPEVLVCRRDAFAGNMD